MDTLDKVVQKFVDVSFDGENIKADFCDDALDFSIDNMKMAIKNTIKERIISEVIENKKTEITMFSKKIVKEERKKSTLISIKELLWEAFIMAIFVGLLGNEITTLVEFFKSFGGEERHTIITIILIVVYAFISLALYVVKFTKDVVNKFVYKQN